MAGMARMRHVPARTEAPCWVLLVVVIVVVVAETDQGQRQGEWQAWEGEEEAAAGSSHTLDRG
eukprot:COSAG02_NODE_2785_length_8032_cov_173.978066_4_plen_63_part_00